MHMHRLQPDTDNYHMHAPLIPNYSLMTLTTCHIVTCPYMISLFLSLFVAQTHYVSDCGWDLMDWGCYGDECTGVYVRVCERKGFTLLTLHDPNQASPRTASRSTEHTIP